MYAKRLVRERVCVEDVDPMYTSRGESLMIDLVQGMVTNRADKRKTFDPAAHPQHGASAISSLAVGGHHACAIHRNGQLYSWGMGSGGRLGQGDKDPTGRSDVAQPCAVRGFGGDL